MIEETFETLREFNNKFPSRFYICPICGALTKQKDYCETCTWRSDGLFKTMNKGYKYTIKELNLTEEIFQPIELTKGK